MSDFIYEHSSNKYTFITKPQIIDIQLDNNKSKQCFNSKKKIIGQIKCIEINKIIDFNIEYIEHNSNYLNIPIENCSIKNIILLIKNNKIYVEDHQVYNENSYVGGAYSVYFFINIES